MALTSHCLPGTCALVVFYLLLSFYPQASDAQCVGGSGSVTIDSGNYQNYLHCDTIDYPSGVVIRPTAGYFYLPNLRFVPRTLWLNAWPAGNLNLTMLSNLTHVREIRIESNPFLLSTRGLDKLRRVDTYFRILGNPSLRDYYAPALESADIVELNFPVSSAVPLTGNFSSLVNITSQITLDTGAGLTTFAGWFPKLTRVDTIQMQSNGAQNLDGFSSVRELARIELSDLPYLTSISGLSNVRGPSLRYFSLGPNLDALTDVSGIGWLTSVTQLYRLNTLGNTSVNFAGLNSIRTIEQLEVMRMDWLGDSHMSAAFSGLTSVNSISVTETNLTTLNPFGNSLPAQPKGIVLIDNPSFNSLAAMSHCTAIRGDLYLYGLSELKSLHGLHNLRTIGTVDSPAVNWGVDIISTGISHLDELRNLEAIIAPNQNINIISNAQLVSIRGLCGLKNVMAQDLVIDFPVIPMCCDAARSVNNSWNQTAWTLINPVQLTCSGTNTCNAANNFTCSSFPSGNPSSSSSSTGNGPSGGGDNDNMAAIIGGAVGGAVVLIVIVGTACYCCRKGKDTKGMPV